jgi:hypothetical protein
MATEAARARIRGKHRGKKKNRLVIRGPHADANTECVAGDCPGEWFTTRPPCGAKSGNAKEIARSLEGRWRQELLFVLEQSLDLYQTYQQKIQICDQRIDEQLRGMDSRIDPLRESVPEPRRGTDARKTSAGFWTFVGTCTASRVWTLQKSTASKCRLRKP